MQVTFYLTEPDKYIIDLIDDVSRRQRKSRSAVMLSILEEYFEKGNRLGEILVDMRVLTPADLSKALALQERSFTEKLLGEVMASEQGIEEEAIQRALSVQRRFR